MSGQFSDKCFFDIKGNFFKENVVSFYNFLPTLVVVRRKGERSLASLRGMEGGDLLWSDLLPVGMRQRDIFKTLSIYLSEYQLGQRVSHKKVLELSYEDVKSSTNGLIVITPDFDNFTAKLIAADKYSKYMTEIPILEGVTNREYYGRSATSIENKCKIEYGTEQGLAALIYGEKGLSSLPIQDITGEHIDTDNEHMYYYSVEFIK